MTTTFTRHAASRKVCLEPIGEFIANHNLNAIQLDPAQISFEWTYEDKAPKPEGAGTEGGAEPSDGDGGGGGGGDGGGAAGFSSSILAFAGGGGGAKKSTGLEKSEEELESELPGLSLQIKIAGRDAAPLKVGRSVAARRPKEGGLRRGGR